MLSRWCAASLGLAVLGAVGWPRDALADPIEYTEQAIATGTLGQFDFTNSLVTITVTADTAGVTQTPSGLLTNTGQASLSLGGSGAGSFLDPLTAFAAAGASGTVLGISDLPDDADPLDTSLPPGFSYDLRSFLAAVTGASLISPNASFATTSGDLTLFLADDSTFSATMQEVPEPASMALFCGAAAVLIALRGTAKKPAH